MTWRHDMARIQARAEVNQVLGKTASQDEAKDTLKLIAALEAVEVMHRKVPVYVTPAGDCGHGADCESVEIDGESMCPDETEGYTCDHCAAMNSEEYPDWPCSTIKAVQEALS